MTRSLPTALVLVAALALAAAVAIRLAPEPPEPGGFAVGTDPAPGACGNHLPFGAAPEGEGVAFRLVATDAPWPLEDLRWTLYPTPEAQEEAEFLAGTFLEAAEAGPGAVVAYRDTSGSPQTLDAGDALVVASRHYGNLDVIDAAGDLVGGTWACL